MIGYYPEFFECLTADLYHRLDVALVPANRGSRITNLVFRSDLERPTCRAVRRRREVGPSAEARRP